ncbi:NADAR family protein [Gilvimarinus polysaccharolyticus]|uniref:NADAR family protein n=1 Tax=Gilvimarinus polysaccharolyticus TaxID=863921 RepID=UPI001E421ABD|nr:NADAR family protein [Gilvimarinus polysaccharolyticus]
MNRAVLFSVKQPNGDTVFFTQSAEDAQCINMQDPDEPLGRVSPQPFELEDVTWPTAEHYWLAMRFVQEADREAVRLAPSLVQARKLAGGWFKKKRPGWKAEQPVLMSRALYTQCLTYPDMAQTLLDTGEQLLLENSQFDYYWGCGRDRRGENHYGQVLMNIRARLRQRAAE